LLILSQQSSRQAAELSQARLDAEQQTTRTLAAIQADADAARARLKEIKDATEEELKEEKDKQRQARVAATRIKVDTPTRQVVMDERDPLAGDTAFDSDWGRYPDLQLRLRRLQAEERSLNLALRSELAEAKERSKEFNHLKLQLQQPTSTTKRDDDGDQWRHFKVVFRNIDREVTAKLRVYHIVYAKGSSRPPYFWIMQRNEQRISIPPQTDHELDVPPVDVYRSSGSSTHWNYNGYVILVYDEANRLIKQYNSGSYFKENAEVLISVPVWRSFDNDGKLK
jgi:hypothetical protein